MTKGTILNTGRKDRCSESVNRSYSTSGTLQIRKQTIHLERTGVWLRQTEHNRCHSCNKYSVAVNQAMVVAVTKLLSYDNRNAKQWNISVNPFTLKIYGMQNCYRHKNSWNTAHLTFNNGPSVNMYDYFIDLIIFTQSLSIFIM